MRIQFLGNQPSILVPADHYDSFACSSLCREIIGITVKNSSHLLLYIYTLQVLGSGLTIVTIGTTSCVTILSRDAYSNLQDATWIINVTSLTSSTSFITYSKQRSAFAPLVMCYPPSFGAAQVGNVSVFVSPSIGELPRLVGTSTPLSYVNNVICAAKSVFSGSGLCFGEFFEQFMCQFCVFNFFSSNCG